MECSCAGVKAGRAYTVRQLLDGLMLVSGNDAANTLAEGLGGYQAAVARMNAKAAALGARSTHASSPSGLDGPGMESITTPFDLAVIYRAALRYPAFAAIVRQPSSLFPTDDGPHAIVNQNELLKRYPGTLVGKTGFTNLARHTFVGAAQRDGHRWWSCRCMAQATCTARRSACWTGASASTARARRRGRAGSPHPDC